MAAMNETSTPHTIVQPALEVAEHSSEAHPMTTSTPLRSALKHNSHDTPSRPALPHQISDQSTPPLYSHKVSFDTFENPLASLFSYTLHETTMGYEKTRASRVFLCASSRDESGLEALDWAVESLVQDGDELIVVRGIEIEELDKDHEAIRADARQLLREIEQKSVEYDPNRKLSLRIEYTAGRITDTLDRLVALYRPDSVVVGTRGQPSVMQAIGRKTLGLSSVSKYVLSHSPVPVIVVRPERKARKAQDKRRKDPKRGLHFEGERPPSSYGMPPLSQSVSAAISTVPL